MPNAKIQKKWNHYSRHLLITCNMPDYVAFDSNPSDYFYDDVITHLNALAW